MKKSIKTLEVLEIFFNTNPNISFAYFNISDTKELAAQDSGFTVPTIVIFFNGKELPGKFGDINLNELKRVPQKQGRYYLIKRRAKNEEISFNYYSTRCIHKCFL